MNIAIITLATNERFLQGAYNLYKSYLKINSKYPFYCMVWSEVNTTKYKDLPTIKIPKIITKNKRFDLNGDPPPDILSKICVWLLDQFDYILFLDADIILYKNIDDLIDGCKENIENYDIISGFMDENGQHYNWHRYIWNGVMFLKPNKNIFIKMLDYVDISINDEELFTFAYDKKIIRIKNIINIYKKNVFNDNIFHFNNWYKFKKYWETDLGNKIYELLLENPDMVNIFKEIQKLIK